MKNSVGSKQIWKGSIKPSDLSAKAKRALAGATGPTGAQGLPGPPSAAGPGDVYVQSNAQGATIGCCERTTILTTEDPANPGRYLLVFKGAFTSPPASIGYAVPLFLWAGGTDLDSITPSGTASFVVAMSTVADLSDGTELAVDIDTVDTDQEVSFAPGGLELIAVKVAEVHE